LDPSHACAAKRLGLAERIDMNTIQPDFHLATGTVDEGTHLQVMPDASAYARGAGDRGAPDIIPIRQFTAAADVYTQHGSTCPGSELQ